MTNEATLSHEASELRRMSLLACSAVPVRKTLLDKPAVVPKESFLSCVWPRKRTEFLRMSLAARKTAEPSKRHGSRIWS